MVRKTSKSPAVKKAGGTSGAKSKSRASPKRVNGRQHVSRRAVLAGGLAAIVAPMTSLARAAGGVHLATDTDHGHWDMLIASVEKNNPPKGWFLNWLAELIQRPHVPLDPLAIVGPPASGKRTIYEAASLLLPESCVMRAHDAILQMSADGWQEKLPSLYLMAVDDLAGKDLIGSMRRKDGRYLKFIYTSEDMAATTPANVQRIELRKLTATIPKETLLPALYNERLAFHESLAHRLHRAA